MSLTTSCPSCGTTFRVVQDQLKISEGWVRCGHCSEVFDATANRRAYRDAARKRIARFAEMYVDTPLAVCRARDPKGLYRQGMKIPYEPPLAPELVLHGAQGMPQEHAAAVVSFLEQRGWL